MECVQLKVTGFDSALAMIILLDGNLWLQKVNSTIQLKQISIFI